jgi:hypothetical protein
MLQELLQPVLTILQHPPIVTAFQKMRYQGTRFLQQPYNLRRPLAPPASAAPMRPGRWIYRSQMQCICRAAEQIHLWTNVFTVLPYRYICRQMQCVCFPALWEMGLLTRPFVGSTVWLYSLLGHLGIPKNFFILTTVQLPLF